jgi:chemotaxis protein methyltransferase CheR
LQYRSVAEYVAAVEKRGEAEFEFLLETLTVNETYFFREEDHFQTMLAELWPEWVRAGDNPIRIWSAGSSTGCEAYTLAILLREKGLVGGGRSQLELVGTDVNNRVLEEARTGLYGEFSLRGVAPYFRQKYFVKEGQKYRLDAAVREMVTFRRVNLLNPNGWEATGQFHAIFCRNVLIYFDQQAKRRAVGLMSRALRNGGALIVGRSESLFNIAEAPPLVNLGGTLLHRKPQ